jgi:hypothetical protein
MIGAFAIYSTNFIAYTNTTPIFGTIYGIVIVTRGLFPLILHDERLFRRLPFIHLLVLFLTVTLALIFNDITVYLIGISVSSLLGVYTGSYVYSLEVTWSKRLLDPSKFFSLISGSEAIAFFLAPIITYLTTSKLIFLVILSSLTSLGFLFLLYFAYLNRIEIKPKFFTGRLSLIKRAKTLAMLGAFNWFLQYLWMGIVFELGVKMGISSSLILIGVELETAIYMSIQFVISKMGFKRFAKLRVVSGLLIIYALIVSTLVSLSFMNVSLVMFFILLIAIAVSNSPLESLINTLVSSTESLEISTVVVSFNYVGGGMGYVLASLLLKFLG